MRTTEGNDHVLADLSFSLTLFWQRITGKRHKEGCYAEDDIERVCGRSSGGLCRSSGHPGHVDANGPCITPDLPSELSKAAVASTSREIRQCLTFSSHGRSSGRSRNRSEAYRQTTGHTRMCLPIRCIYAHSANT